MTEARSDEGGQVLIIGADLVMPKLFYFSEELRRIGYRYAIYSHDVTEEANTVAARAGATLLAGPPHRRSIGRLLKDAWTLWRTVRRSDFHHADLYCDYHILAAFMYLIILRMKRIPVVMWCRGELLDWDVFTWWQRLYFRVGMRLAQLVILKERYMIATLKGAGIYRESNTIELHNTVPLPARDAKKERFPHATVRLLFLNTFKLWRGSLFCVDLAAALRDAGIPFTLKMVGEKGGSPGLIEEGRRVSERIAALGLDDRVSVHPFTPEPGPYYRDADIYLLPATLIYCNFGLLEAMANGLVPMVNSHDADHALIIEHGICGFGLPLEPALWVEKIRWLAEERETARAMAEAARVRIDNHFSTATMFKRYAQATGLIPQDLPAAPGPHKHQKHL